jgi:tetratricopeptide (TPR) repeat protein
MWPFGKKKEADSSRDFSRARMARAELLWKQGSRYLGRKRYDRAIDSLSEAYELEPSRLEGRLNLGAALYLAGRPADALPHLKYVLAIEPQNTVALLNLAATYDALGMLDESIGALEKLVADRPRWADAHYNLGVAYYKREAFDQAAAALQAELRLNPKHDAARTLLNEIHLKPRRKPKPLTETGGEPG